MVKAVCSPSGDGQEFVFRTWTTTPSGKVIYAKNYGLKAFRIPVGDSEGRRRNSQLPGKGERGSAGEGPEKA